MYTILWEFRVPPDRRDAYETAYGPHGPWARLFAKAAGFIGVELLRCTEQAGRYVTIDRWRSLEDFQAFQRLHGEAYRALDARLEGVAGEEEFVGAFDE